MGNLQESQGPTSESTNGAGQYDRRYRPLGHGMGVHHECCIKRILKMNWYYCLFKAKAHQFFRFQSLSVFDSTIQDFRGTSHVEKIVRIDWRSKWQEIARRNDDAVDGIIFLKRGRKPTSAIAFAQVKCGPGYRKDAQIRPNHIGVQVGAKYIEDHLPRWRSLTFPVVMIYVDPSSNPKEPEAWWTDLKKPESYTNSNQNIILLPKHQKFGPHSKGDFFKLCGPKIHYQRLAKLKLTSDDLKQGSLSDSLKTNARNYYTHWSNSSSLVRTNPDLGEIIVNRVGWRHITRKDRLSLAVSELSSKENLKRGGTRP